MSTEEEKLSQILVALKATENLIQSLEKDSDTNLTEIATLKQQVEGIKGDVEYLMNTVRGTNGEGLQIKVNSLQNRVKNLESWKDSTQNDTKITAKGKWIIVASVITAIGGIAAAIISNLP